MILEFATAGLAAGIIGILVDGRNAVVIAALACSIALSMTAALVAGAVPAVIFLGVAAAAGAGAIMARTLARRFANPGGLDPTTPIFAPPEGLFGPRSLRVICAAVTIPVASWINYTLSIGDTTVTQGALFAPAYIWLCGIARFLTARTLEDVAVALVLVLESVMAGFLFLDYASNTQLLLATGAAIPVVAMVASWMSGRFLRHKRSLAP